MKIQQKKWLAVGALAAFGIGVGSAVAVPALNAVERPAGADVDTSIAPATLPSVQKSASIGTSSLTKPSTHAESPSTSSSPDSPATPSTPATPASPASADSASSAS